MVGREEISTIMKSTGLSFEEIVVPYPDRIVEGGRTYTFGWVLRRNGDRCQFLKESGCAIYESRPWICRTYPFMLDEDGLSIHPCEGGGRRGTLPMQSVLPLISADDIHTSRNRTKKSDQYSNQRLFRQIGRW
jgi:Fe-S-cluster containining protein